MKNETNILNDKISRLEKELKEARDIIETKEADYCDLKNEYDAIVEELKQQNDELAQSERKYRALFEGSRDGIVFISPDGKFIDCNKAYLQITGYTLEELRQIDFYKITPKKWHDWERSEIVEKQLLQRGYTDTYEKEYIRKDDTVFPVELTSYKYEDIDGNILLWGVARDITERKKSEDELHLSQKKYRKKHEQLEIITDHLPLLIGYIDRDEKYLYVNKLYAGWYGMEKKDIIGKLIKDIVPEESYKGILPNLQRVFKGEKFSFENISYNVDGKLKVVRAVYVPHFGKNGKVKAFVGLVEDITELKQTERNLQKSEKKLRELNATKDKFFSIIAHDLRNPFNSIMGFSEILLQETRNEIFTSNQDYAEQIYGASQQVMKLLNNLLEWSRSQTGSLHFKPEEFSIYEITEPVISLTRNNAAQKNIRVKESIDDNFIIFADKNMIYTVLRNLMSNALKFTNSNGEIVFEVIRMDNHLQISVIDNGIGIKDKDLKKLFRIDESLTMKGTEGEKGTGLGLILCKEFVERHEGKIWVESTYGKGSTFRFTIPLSSDFEASEARN